MFVSLCTIFLCFVCYLFRYHLAMYSFCLCMYAYGNIVFKWFNTYSFNISLLGKSSHVQYLFTAFGNFCYHIFQRKRLHSCSFKQKDTGDSISYFAGEISNILRRYRRMMMVQKDDDSQKESKDSSLSMECE